MECLRSATTTFATTLENPACLTSRWITSTREGGGSLDLDETSTRGAGPADSTPEEVERFVDQLRQNIGEQFILRPVLSH